MYTKYPRKRSWRYWIKLTLVGLVGGCVILPFARTLQALDALTRPAQGAICCTTPADLGFTYEEVRLNSNDGVTLAGWYVPSKNRSAVILLHGYGGNRIGMLYHMRLLAQHGYGVLLYDLRAHGESGGNFRTYGWLDVKDAMAAVAYLQSRSDIDPQRIGIFGSSVGGQIAIRAAAESGAIKVVVADGPSIVTVQDLPSLVTLIERVDYPFDWLLDRGIEWRAGVKAPPGVSEVVGKIAPRPVLLISTGQGIEQRGIRRYYALAREPKTLWEIPEAEHGGGPQVRPQEYAGKVVTFFNQALLPTQGSNLRREYHC